MANPVDFEGANSILLAPVGDDNCGDLPIARMKGEIVSCWRLTPDELDTVIMTGVICFQHKA